MKSLYFCGLILSLVLGGSQGSGRAQGVLDWSRRSPIACIATAQSVSVMPTAVYQGTTPYLPVYAHFTLKSLLGWGTVPSTFTVAGYKGGRASPTERPSDAYEYHGYFSSFTVGTTYLLFLTYAPLFDGERAADRHLRLEDLGSVPSLVEVSQNAPGFDSKQSLLANILHVLAISITDPSPEVRQDAISEIGSYGPYLYDYSKYPVLAYLPRPPVMVEQNIASMLTDSVIPELTGMEKTASPAMLIKLKTTLGLLQVVGVIPELVAAVPQNGDGGWDTPAYALSSFGVPGAVPLLCKGALAANPNAAVACITALGNVRDVSGAPGLIAALVRGSNGKVRYFANLALIDTTGQLAGNYGPDEFASHEKVVDKFWLDWAAKNKVTVR